ncbi:hypothetical protein MHU86_21939 [Fragilaria crotonensis]|nr:hypothetical protein MHU86_21939 [Fragilaria crotonensis]
MQLTTTATNGSVLPPVRGTANHQHHVPVCQNGIAARHRNLPNTAAARCQGARQPPQQTPTRRLANQASWPRHPGFNPRAAPPAGLLLLLFCRFLLALFEPAGEVAPGTVTGSTQGPSSLHNLLLCSRERSVKMVPEGSPSPGHKPKFLPIRTGNRRAVSDNSAIPADGHTMAKLHRHAVELGSSIWSYAVYVGKNKVPVLPTARHFLRPQTETLRGVVHVKVRRIPEVDAHVHGVPNPLATFQHLHSLPKILTHVTAIVVDDANVNVTVTSSSSLSLSSSQSTTLTITTPAVDRRKDDAVHRRNGLKPEFPSVSLRQSTPAGSNDPRIAKSTTRPRRTPSATHEFAAYGILL